MGIDFDANALVEKLEPAMEQMANKLGVAVTKVWEIMVKQAYVDGTCMILGLVFGYILSIIGYRYCKKQLKKDNIDSGDPEFIFPAMITGFILFFAILFTFVCMRDILTIFLNTDYYVLKQLLKLIK